ncbi:MAG TPA: phosphopantetheine-binding protein, partial [Verrucomicrobiae bacterium]|nr:phosphopantetheine-binding protein [Verrucomicrobiae bacterium]
MDNPNALKERIKELMVENLMLQVTAAEIKDDQPLFGPGSLGLDSVDALQLVVALDKNFGLKIPNPSSAKEIL